MKIANYVSDYDPFTSITIIQNDDGDIILKVHGNGEMRIATSGGKLHGSAMVSVCTAFRNIIEILNNDIKDRF